MSTEAIVPLKTTLLKYKPAFRVMSTDEDEKKPATTVNEDSVQKILDSMFPPKIWLEHDYRWEHHVSTTPATRMDVLHLQQMLNDGLQIHQARETGICPIRRTLYDQCLQELIRQVTVNCTEQGLLLYRLRNEINMTLEAYRRIYESSICFGLRRVTVLERKCRQIEREKSMVVEEMSDYKAKYLSLQREHFGFTNHHNEVTRNLTKLYEGKLENLNLVIEQQRKLIEALNRKPLEI